MALKTLGAADTYAFGTTGVPGASGKKILERSSSKEFTRRNEARDNSGDIAALALRGMVETISLTEYSTATTLPELSASGSTAVTSVEIMASNQDFVKLKTESKNYDFAT